MILTCPQCSTRYHADPMAFGADGRTVRCANCGHRWRARPPADAPRALEPTPAAPPAPRRPGAAAVETAWSAFGMAAWLVGVLAVLVVASAVIGRNEIVAGFPASESLYRTLGLPVTAQLDLQFEDVTSKRLVESGVAVLVVEGEIVNLSPRDRPIPAIKITLLDEGGRQLQHELFRAKEAQLDGGAKTSFSGRLVNPAQQARNFSVSFERGS